MSAFGGKADITICGCLLSQSRLGTKWTCLFALHMSACDPTRTFTAGRDTQTNAHKLFATGLGALGLLGYAVAFGCCFRRRDTRPKPTRAVPNSRAAGGSGTSDGCVPSKTIPV